MVENEPDLPEDWGLVPEVCADGQHRFLGGAPTCGCGKTAEGPSLTLEIINAARSTLAVKVLETVGDVHVFGMPNYAREDILAALRDLFQREGIELKP